MTNQYFVERVYVKQKDLIVQCRKYKLNKNDTNDIIQELYVKLLRLQDIDNYVYNDEPNMGFVFVVLKNMILNSLNKKSYTINIEDINFDTTDDDIITDDKCYQFILDEIEKIEPWFNRKIIELYITKKLSIRTLSKATQITPHYIKPIITSFKKQCRLSIEQSKNQNNNNLF